MPRVGREGSLALFPPCRHRSKLRKIRAKSREGARKRVALVTVRRIRRRSLTLNSMGSYTLAFPFASPLLELSSIFRGLSFVFSVQNRRLKNYQLYCNISEKSFVTNKKLNERKKSILILGKSNILVQNFR